MFLALFNEGTKKQAQLPPQVYFQTVGEEAVAFLPLYYPPAPAKKKSRQILRQKLLTAQKAAADILALPPGLLPYLDYERLCLADGSKYRLALLPQILDQDRPGWRDSSIAIPLRDGFMLQAALILAGEAKWLHLCQAEEAALKEAAALIYSQTGLIAGHSLACPPDPELVIGPGSDCPKPKEGGPVWQNWPRNISDPRGNKLNLHSAEGLLLCAFSKQKYLAWQALPLPQQLRQLARHGAQCGFSPSFSSQESKRSAISSFFSR